MGVRLPSEYQEIQYIEGTSADQYIDSGWLYTDDFEIIAKIYFTGIEQTFYRDEANGYIFRFMFASNVKARFDLGKTTNYAYYNNPADLPALQGDYRTYTIPFKAGEQVEIDVDGYRVSGSCANSAEKTITHKFAKNKHRLYGYQIVSESVLVRDFVPCYRKSDSEPGMYDLVTNQFFTNAGAGEFLVGPDVIDSISPLMVAWRRIMMAAASVAKKLTKLIATSTTGLVSFDTNVEMPTKVTCAFSPVQEGTGDPSPDNVRPISGWTGANIAAMAKNMFNPQANTAEPTSTTPKRYAPGYIYPGMHATSPNTNWWSAAISGFTATSTGFKFTRVKDNNSYGVGYVFKANPGDRLTRSGTLTNASFSGWQFYDFSMNRISSVNTDTATVPAGTFYGFLTVLATAKDTEAEIANFIICNGEAPITFEPYTGTTLPINWQTEAGTVYGGTVTLNEDGSADLTVSWGSKDLGSINWLQSSSSNCFYTPNGAVPFKKHSYTVGRIICTCLKNGGGRFSEPWYGADGTFQYYAGAASVREIYVKDERYSRAEEFKAGVAGELFVYEIDDPQTYHFDNIGQLKSFLGTNNIWHNMNGDITVEYWNKQ